MENTTQPQVTGVLAPTQSCVTGVLAPTQPHITSVLAPSLAQQLLRGRSKTYTQVKQGTSGNSEHKGYNIWEGFKTICSDSPLPCFVGSFHNSFRCNMYCMEIPLATT